MTCSFEPFFNFRWCNFALNPLNFSWICNCLCKFNWGHIIYDFGVFFCKDFNGDVPMMFCATHVGKVWTPEPGTICSFCPATFQLQCIWNVVHLIFSILFHVIFMSSSSSLPLAYCHMLWADFPPVAAPSLCQIHRHYSVSGIVVLLSRCLNSCNAWWSCHVIMLFTPKLRLRPKPLQCNKCIWSWWLVIITFI